MKPVKISYSVYITSSFLVIYFILSAFQSVEPANVQARNESFPSESQSYLENNNLSRTDKNNNSSTLIFSNPFYISNTTLILDKIPIEKSNATYKEVQFFVERGVVNASLVTYNVGYYIEDSHIHGTYSEFKPQSTGLKAEPGPNYAQGSGIFLTENGGIIKWDAIDQIVDKSGNKLLYAGMIFFSPTDNNNNELAFLKNQVGLYKFSIYFDNTTELSPSVTATATAPATAPATYRSIWLWP